MIASAQSTQPLGTSQAVPTHKTFLDASGRPEQHPGVVVAGCVSTSDQWERLEPDWNRILEEEGVKVINGFRALHMRDLAASRRGFDGWTPKQKAVLLDRLGLLLRVRVRFLVGCGVPISVYEGSQFAMARRSGWAPHPLTFCAARCVEEIGGWCIRNNINGAKMAYVFEEGDPNSAGIRALMEDIAGKSKKSADFRYAGWSFGSKRLVGLQAADWVAYETFLWGHRGVLPLYGDAQKSKYPVRRSLEVLGSIDNRIVYVASVEELLASFHERLKREEGTI